MESSEFLPTSGLDASGQICSKWILQIEAMWGANFNSLQFTNSYQDCTNNQPICEIRQHAFWSQGSITNILICRQLKYSRELELALKYNRKESEVISISTCLVLL